jgi:hypothetical protein
MGSVGLTADRQLIQRIDCSEEKTMRTTAAMFFSVLAMMIAPQAVAQQACPSLVISTNDDAVNGNTSSPCALIANPGPDGISLREALLAANNATGSGIIAISFTPGLAGATITLGTPFPPITRGQITLTGLTSNGQPDITIDASQLSSLSPVPIMFVAASSFAMSGLKFPSIPTNFVGIQIGGSSQSVSSPSQICCFQIAGNAFSNGTGTNTFAISVPANISNETISDVTIANNSFSQLFEAINFQGGGPGASNSVIQDVAVFGNSFSQMTSNATAAVEFANTIGANNIIQRAQVMQNTFTGNFQGISLNNNGSASGNTIQNTLIARNVFSGNLQALGVAAGVNSNSANNLIANTQIVDNLVDLTGYGGQGAVTTQIIDNQSGGTNNKVTGISFINNTIYNGDSDPPGWGVWVISSGGVTGVSIWNTIFWGNESNPPLNGITSPSQVSYSIINQSGFTGVNNNVNTDPLFVNSGSGDFHLQSGSPARGAGITPGAPALDLDCQLRGSPPSIGAYEFDGPNICPSTYSAPLTATPTSGTPPLVVTFMATGLTPPMTYTINFGDGTTGALTQSSCIGVNAIVGGQGGIQCSGSASHIYTAAGSYGATLLNALGLTVGTVAITVTGAAPKVSFTATSPSTPGAKIEYNRIGASGGIAPPDKAANASVPTISSFTASPAAISPFDAGASVTLSWSVASATSLSISGLGAVLGNSIQVSPSQTTTYTLTASNAQGAVTAQTTVTVAGYRSRQADPLSR